MKNKCTQQFSTRQSRLTRIPQNYSSVRVRRNKNLTFRNGFRAKTDSIADPSHQYFVVLFVFLPWFCIGEQTRARVVKKLITRFIVFSRDMLKISNALDARLTRKKKKNEKQQNTSRARSHVRRRDFFTIPEPFATDE